jgi:hypothetical protein
MSHKIQLQQISPSLTTVLEQIHPIIKPMIEKKSKSFKNTGLTNIKQMALSKLGNKIHTVVLLAIKSYFRYLKFDHHLRILLDSLVCHVLFTSTDEFLNQPPHMDYQMAVCDKKTNW